MAIVLQLNSFKMRNAMRPRTYPKSFHIRHKRKITWIRYEIYTWMEIPLSFHTMYRQNRPLYYTFVTRFLGECGKYYREWDAPSSRKALVKISLWMIRKIKRTNWGKCIRVHDFSFSSLRIFNRVTVFLVCALLVCEKLYSINWFLSYYYFVTTKSNASK